MDWTKAKSLLIVALLLTNIMLISVYFLQHNRNEIREDHVTNNTIALLESKDIHVKAKIAEQKKRMPVLSVERSELDRKILHKAIREQEGMGNGDKKEEYMQYGENFLKRCDLYDDCVEVVGCETTSNGDVVVTFGTVYEGFSVEKSWMTCTISHGKVTDVERVWYQPIQFGDIKKKIMPATSALIQFMSQIKAEEESSGTMKGSIDINQIELVYWLDPYSLGDGISLSADTAFPAWKITYNGNEERYIMAYEQ